MAQDFMLQSYLEDLENSCFGCLGSLRVQWL